MSFDADITACAAIVEKGDPDRFVAAMASPVVARRVLFPLYAFNIEVARAPWVTQESMIAEMRLQWWRDALEEIADGKPPRRHEVVTPLSKIIDRASAQRLDRLVAARRWDIYRDPFEDEGHFQRYLEETAGALMYVAARSLAAEAQAPLPDTADPALTALGYAAGLARFLQAVPALEEHNRIPLVDGRAEAIRALATAARAGIPSKATLKSVMPKAAHPALTEAFLATAILQQAARTPSRVAEGSLGVHPLKRSILLLLWS